MADGVQIYVTLPGIAHYDTLNSVDLQFRFLSVFQVPPKCKTVFVQALRQNFYLLLLPLHLMSFGASAALHGNEELRNLQYIT